MGIFFSEFFERFHKAGAFQVGRAVALRERAGLVDGRFENSTEFAKCFCRNRFARGDGAADGFEEHRSAGEGLANVVVQFEADLALLAFQRGDQLSRG